MTKQVINTGTVANDGTGDGLRTAFTKINENFTEVYNAAQIYLTPNIAYTGIFNSYPVTIPIVKGEGIVFTGTNEILQTADKYWFKYGFESNNYDLSGTETLDFYNVGGMGEQFVLGNSNEALLENVDLHDVTSVKALYLSNLPSLTSFNANNLSYIKDTFAIESMDNVNSQINFPNLKLITSFYYGSNDVLENTPQFPSLESIYDLYITDNTSNQNTMIFDSLKHFFYGAIYNNAGMLAGPIFPSLTSMDQFYMYNNDNMIDPPQFPVLQTVTGGFSFWGHNIATTAPATPALVSCNSLGWNNNTLMVNGFDFSSLKEVNGNVDISNCALDVTSVNYILTTLASLDGTNGTTSYDNHTVNLGGGTNAIPTGAGLTAIATLQARGCTVYYNS